MGARSATLVGVPDRPSLPTPASTLPLVALGGAVGAVVRWGAVEAWPWSATWAILVCNVIGSALLGVLAGFAPGPRSLVSADAYAREFRRRRLVGTGFCGGLTTLSTVAVSAAGQLADGRRLTMVGDLGVTLALTLGAAAFGLALAGRARRATGETS